MRHGILALSLLVLAGCGANTLRRPPAATGPPADNECAVDVMNGRSMPMAVTVYARSPNDMGVLRPGRSVRYAEECTPRSWTVTAMPRSTSVADAMKPSEGNAPGTPAPELPSTFSQTVEVRPGVVVRVVL